ncbi:Protein of unknown function [Bryocella elongata]|uniref:DUF2029 domain-containing protein n=1 Tax=Bryocella elongata TaxID=863522 RepID=A0A1H5SZ44_9BACT|nr:glycosyltransferase 87 family protein [Bryocella elongata]SEF55208.1 Protein of unknown function [Bryocella elongata]
MKQTSSDATTTRTVSLMPRTLLVVCWLLATIGMVFVAATNFPAPGWDMNVYRNAIHSVQIGHDPWADGVAVQKAHIAYTRTHPYEMPPFTYVYSPITLPLLQLLARIPEHPLKIAYWALFILANIITMVVLLRTCLEQKSFRDFRASSDPHQFESTLFWYLAPASVFFAGLLYTSVELSGNLAYILYAMMLATAMLGWRRNVWSPFYLAVVLAACFKAPMLTLLALPVFTTKTQWRAATLTGALGLTLFFLPSRLWPAQFHHYLEAVSLQFSINHDFGDGLASIIGNLLFYLGKPYELASLLVYALYASAVLLTLYVLSRCYLRGDFPLHRWLPVLLCGIILLNPRIKEYDVAPITLPMAIIAWRVLGRGITSLRTGFECLLLFVTLSAVATCSPIAWKPTECFLLLGIFALGASDLLQISATKTAPPLRPSGDPFDELRDELYAAPRYEPSGELEPVAR